MNLVDKGKQLNKLWNDYADAKKLLHKELTKLHEELGSAYSADNEVRTLYEEGMKLLAKEHWTNCLYSKGESK